MIVITEEQKNVLLTYIENVSRYIEDDDLDAILDDLDAKITEIGFDKNYNLNSVGLELQKLYDQIYYQN